MDVSKCSACGHEIYRYHNFCPRCGKNLNGESNKQWQDKNAPKLPSFLSVIVIGLVALLALTNIYDDSNNRSNDVNSLNSDGGGSSVPEGVGSNDINSSNSAGVESSILEGVTWHAHDTVNIRKGPSTDSKVVGQLTRGDDVRLEATTDDWKKIIEDTHKGSYVYSPALKLYDVPNIGIVSWNWRKDPDFGTDGTVKWTAEIRNNTDSYIDNVLLKFSTYDSEGNIMTTDTGYATGLSPSGSTSTKGYATYYGGEEKARLQVESR